MFEQLGVLRLASVSTVQVLAGIVLTSGLFGLPFHWQRWRNEGTSTRIQVVVTHGIGMALGFVAVAVAASSELRLNAPDRIWILLLGASLAIVTVLSLTVAWLELSGGSRVMKGLGIAVALVVTICSAFPASSIGPEGGFAALEQMHGDGPTRLPPFFRLVNQLSAVEPLAGYLPTRSYQTVIGSAWASGQLPQEAILVCLVVAGASIVCAGLVLRRSWTRTQVAIVPDSVSRQ
jgi:hypothetical protein